MQLPNFTPGPKDDWPALREAQRRALRVDGTGMVVTIDVGEMHEIHPFDKRQVGARLAAWALHEVYGCADVVPGGPRYASSVAEGRVVRVTLSHVAGGLRATRKRPGQWELAGEDGAWHHAIARLEPDGVTLTAPGVSAPVAVRYAWRANPLNGLLYNDAGYPLAPFTARVGE